MKQYIWVDSRAREPEGTHSDFEVVLRESLHLDKSRVRIDNCSFVDSFYTTDGGAYLYFASGAGMTWVQIPEGAYNGPSLAASIGSATGRTTIYDVLKNTITHSLASPTQPWLDDASLGLMSSSGFPSDASREDPRSLNGVLGEGFNTSTQVVWSFVRMAPYTRSHKLRCEDTHGPRGDASHPDVHSTHNGRRQPSQRVSSGRYVSAFSGQPVPSIIRFAGDRLARPSGESQRAAIMFAIIICLSKSV